MTMTPGCARPRALMMMVLGITLGLGVSAAFAKGKKTKPDPALVCVGTKQALAGKFCGTVLNAWAKFEKSGDAGKRDAAIAKAQAALDTGFTKAEQKSSAAGIDCAASFITSAEAGTAIDSASGALVGEANSGLDTSNSDQAKCGAKIVKAAAAKCQGLLRAEGAYQRIRTKSQAASKRTAAIADVRGRFASAFTKATGGSCPTAATADSVETAVDDIVTRVVKDTLAAPEAGNGDYVGIAASQTTYQGRTYNPTCIKGTPYRFWARRGTVNKLVVYYQGGGACWEQLTCSIPTCDADVADSDNPGRASTGFADLSNPQNPFRDWSAVFVSYCSCDIHFGDAAQDYTNTDPAHPLHIEHRGYQN